MSVYDGMLQYYEQEKNNIQEYDQQLTASFQALMASFSLKKYQNEKKFRLSGSDQYGMQMLLDLVKKLNKKYPLLIYWMKNEIDDFKEKKNPLQIQVVISCLNDIIQIKNDIFDIHDVISHLFQSVVS